MLAYINPDKTIFCISGTSLKKKLISEGYSKDILDEEGNMISTQKIEPVFEDDPFFIDLLEVEFDNSIITNPVYDSKSKKVIQFISDDEKKDEKKKRVLAIIISSADYASVDSEGIRIFNSDIGPAIIARFFKGDPNAEMAFLQKWNFLTSIQEKTPEQEAEIEMIKAGYVAKEEFKDFLLSLINK